MFDPYNPCSMFNSSSDAREYLSETSKNKIRALLPIVQKLYPDIQFEIRTLPDTAEESISFLGYMFGQKIVQYSFWGDMNGNIYSITVYSTDFLLQTLYQTFSQQGNIWGFKITHIELDRDGYPHFLDITIATEN